LLTPTFIIEPKNILVLKLTCILLRISRKLIYINKTVKVAPKTQVRENAIAKKHFTLQLGVKLIVIIYNQAEYWAFKSSVRLLSATSLEKEGYL